MWKFEKIAKIFKYKIIKSEEGLDIKPSILFCVMDAFQKRDLLSEAKKLGFKPVYSIKHPVIKVVMQITTSRKIETDKLKNNYNQYKHF